LQEQRTIENKLIGPFRLMKRGTGALIGRVAPSGNTVRTPGNVEDGA